MQVKAVNLEEEIHGTLSSTVWDATVFKWTGDVDPCLKNENSLDTQSHRRYNVYQTEVVDPPVAGLIVKREDAQWQHNPKSPRTPATSKSTPAPDSH